MFGLLLALMLYCSVDNVEAAGRSAVSERAGPLREALEAYGNSSDPAVRSLAALKAARYFVFEKRSFEDAFVWYQRAEECLSPAESLWPEAVMGLAMCMHHMQPVSVAQMESAEAYYNELIDHDPGSDYAARALFNLGRLAELRDVANDQREVSKAHAYYRRIREQWPQASIAVEALIADAGLYIQQGLNPDDYMLPLQERRVHVEKGLNMLETWFQTSEDAVWKPIVAEFIGDVLTLIWTSEDDRRRALTYYLRAMGDEGMLEGLPPLALKKSVDRINTGYLYWKIGKLAQEFKKQQVALEYYCRMLTEAQSYEKGSEAWIRLRSMGFHDEAVRARVRKQWEQLGKSALEIERHMRHLVPPPDIELNRQGAF